MTNWYTSDLHLMHRLVAGKRGFWRDWGGEPCECDWTPNLIGMPHRDHCPYLPQPDTAAHDAALIANWNSVVAPQDTVWVLGDLTLRNPDDIWDKIDRMRGWKRLVLGNHDAAFAGSRGSWKHQRSYLEHFESVHDYASVRLEGQQVMLSHFPLNGDGEGKPDRCAPYRLRDEGMPVVHGHTHRSGQLSRSDRGTLQIHVGLDAHDLKPVSEAWVMRMLRDDRVTRLMTEYGNEETA